VCEGVCNAFKTYQTYVTQNVLTFKLAVYLWNLLDLIILISFTYYKKNP